jgi:tetratricopeptide (TPR) repeat protein
VALERWAPAAIAFEQAALEAERGNDPRRADLWVQSGNSWLAANDGGKARKAFDAALATTLLAPELRGEVHLDRGRAGVALGDLAGARADINKGLELVPADPFGWYLSAALAQREGNLARARSDIAKAVQLAPADAPVLLLAGNIAGVSGDLAAARNFFERAAKASPDSESGKAAAAALAANPAAAPDPAVPASPAQKH